MNELMEFYNREIRFPDLVEESQKCEERIQDAEGLRNILLPTHYIKLTSMISSFIDEQSARLVQLRKKKYGLKDRLGVH